MLPNHPTIDKALIAQPEVCKAIGQTRSGLEKLRKKIRPSRARSSLARLARPRATTSLPS